VFQAGSLSKQSDLLASGKKATVSRGFLIIGGSGSTINLTPITQARQGDSGCGVSDRERPGWECGAVFHVSPRQELKKA
jgi:hypothetical protein